jgi:molybdopterin synthase catalytic subunit
VFEGIVRETEGRPQEPSATIEALDYQAYEPMAQTMIAKYGVVWAKDR